MRLTIERGHLNSKKPVPFHVYIQAGNLPVCRFLWFHNWKPNEMLMGIYGLRSEQVVVKYMFPERVVTREELKGLTFNYSAMTEINKTIDHITCHSDGTFHIKTTGDEEVYTDTLKRIEPLGPDTPMFLHFIILSDVAEKYSNPTSKLKEPYTIIGTCDKQQEIIVIEGRFSGAKYELEEEMARNIFQWSPVAGMVRLTSGTLKGVLCPQCRLWPQEVLRDRPSGTIVLFIFPVAQDQFLIKGFAFS
jgi:hypothetical protein